MAKKPSTKTPATPKEAKAPAAETAAPKADAPAADAASSSDSSAPAKKSGGGGGRPISYFSSVSTDEYRAGWAAIFGKPEAKPAKAKSGGKLPAALELDIDSLDADVRDRIEAAFRQQAKKKRLNYDKLAANGQVSLRISCEISE